MDYKKHYDLLIDRSKNRNTIGYVEKHHILPKCIGGTDESSNLVALTPEEHYLAHQLLIKIYPDNEKLIYAAVMMIPRRSSNKLYGWIRREFSRIQSINQSGVKNNQYGTRWIHNLDLCKNKKLKKFDPLPEGWIEGRKIKFDFSNFRCKNCENEFKRIKLENFCSELCKRHYKSSAIKIIDDNKEKMLSYYKEVWSITKTLSYFGIKSDGRAGNKYFSKILKENNLYVRPRRNSSRSIKSDAPAL